MSFLIGIVWSYRVDSSHPKSGNLRVPLKYLGGVIDVSFQVITVVVPTLLTARIVQEVSWAYPSRAYWSAERHGIRFNNGEILTNSALEADGHTVRPIGGAKTTKAA